MIPRKTGVQIALALAAMLVLFYCIVLLRHGARSRELISIVERNNLAGVRELLSKGVDVNIRDEDGNTPLLKAAEFNRASIAELLVQHGADVNARNNAGNTPLLHAAQNGDWALTKILLAKGAAIEARTASGDTALILAIRFARLNVASLLCLHGADVNAANTAGHTSLMVAAKAGSLSAVRFLLSRGGLINARSREGTTALIAAAVGAGYKPGFPGASSTITMGDHHKVLLFLLSRGAEPNARTSRGLTALGAVVQAGRLEMARQLLLKGADPALLDATTRSTLLVTTVAIDDTGLLKILLRHTWDLDARDSHGHTALTMAAQRGEVETIRLLLNAGAGINATCAPKNKSQGGTALMVAASAGSRDALRMLLNRGAVVNAVDSAGKTALLVALQTYRDFRPSWIIMSRRGTRMVFTPAERKRLDLGMLYDRRRFAPIVSVLLSRGADPNIRDKYGNTALRLARQSKDVALIRMLQQAGAKR